MRVRAEDDRRERLLIRLFGPLAIEGARTLGPRDLGGSRPKQVLEILLTARGHRVPTDRLADLLWGEQLPQNAAGSLQTFVSVLRRHLASDRERARELVVTEAEAYRFATDLVDLDLDRFDQLLERSAHEPTRSARRSLEEAVGLVRGEVLEAEPYADWAQGLRSAALPPVPDTARRGARPRCQRRAAPARVGDPPAGGPPLAPAAADPARAGRPGRAVRPPTRPDERARGTGTRRAARARWFVRL